MIHFNLLTEDAYVQTGEFKVKKFYMQGQHWLQGVGNVVGDQSSDETSNMADLQITGLYEVSFDGAASGGDAVFLITVDGEVVYSQTVADGDTDTITALIAAKEGQAIVVDASDANATASNEKAVFTGEKLFPYTFSADWAVFNDGRDDLKGYDPGSYSIGIKPSHTIITVPKIKKVSLLYYYSEHSTQEERALVQFDGNAAALQVLGLLDGSNNRVAFTYEEYIDKFAPEGYNRFGKVWPKGIAESYVNELTSYTGNFVLPDGSVSNVTVYMEPVFMHNQLPLFDYVYLDAGFAGDFVPAADVGISGYFLRWLGYAPSENIAAINRSGSALERDGYIWDGSAMKTPSDAVTSHDGVAYTGADEYNVRNHRRY